VLHACMSAVDVSVSSQWTVALRFVFECIVLIHGLQRMNQNTTDLFSK